MARPLPSGVTLVIPLVAAAIALTGCNVRIETGRQGPQPAQTGPAPTATGPAPQQTALLTLAEVQAMPASPGGFEQAPDPDSAATETNASEPCGGRITQRLKANRAVAFSSRSAQTGVRHAIYRPAPGLADRVIGEVRQDMRPGCRPFTEATPAGPVTVEFLGEVRLPTLGDDRLATQSRVRFSDGRILNAMTAAVRSGPVLIRVRIQSIEPISEAFLIELVTAAVDKAAKLDAQPG